MLLSFYNERTQGTWEVKFDQDLDIRWIEYNNKGISKKRTEKLKEKLWDLFNERYDLEEEWHQWQYERKHHHSL